MSTHSPQTSTGDDEEMEMGERLSTMTSTASRYVGDGTAALLAGGMLLVRAVRSNSRGRALLQGAGGLALLGFGLRRRMSGDSNVTDAIRSRDEDGDADDDADVSADAYESTYGEAGGPTPGPSGSPTELESSGEPDEETVEFVEDEESTDHPDLDGGPDDPRHEHDQDGVEVDLSETATADEPGEAVGPDPEQAQPTQTDDPEPEDTAPEDASNVRADEPEALDEEEAGTESDDVGSDESAGEEGVLDEDDSDAAVTGVDDEDDET